jgi:hypothetical protein
MLEWRYCSSSNAGSFRYKYRIVVKRRLRNNILNPALSPGEIPGKDERECKEYKDVKECEDDLSLHM